MGQIWIQYTVEAEADEDRILGLLLILPTVGEHFLDDAVYFLALRDFHIRVAFRLSSLVISASDWGMGDGTGFKEAKTLQLEFIWHEGILQ